jgi:plasmid stabilization system protein ParE
MPELVILPEAEQDIGAAYEWYEERRPGLGDKFLDCVNTCLQRIRQTPTMHGYVFETYRRGLVQHFPYAIFYESTDEVVTVYCVCHTSQNPNKWRNRLSGDR